jgi:glutathione S-transferase
MITLYNIPVSGNCHKIRLLLSFLGLDYQTYNLDLTVSEQKSADYLLLNPFGQAPVLTDGEITIRDSQAILVYLAKTYGGSSWWPDDAVQLAHITQWLSTAANEITYGPARIRAHYKFAHNIDMALAKATSDKVLSIIEQHLIDRSWLVNEQVSIADIAIYPYLALAHEGHVELAAYPNILTWLARFESQANFVTMPGIVNPSTKESL